MTQARTSVGSAPLISRAKTVPSPMADEHPAEGTLESRCEMHEDGQLRYRGTQGDYNIERPPYRTTSRPPHNLIPPHRGNYGR